mgnify:CR=1 FL=1
MGNALFDNVLVSNHPLIQDRLARLRDVRTGPSEFRVLVRQLALLMAYEATRELATVETEVRTPIAFARVRRLAARPICLVPVLRAGLGMLDGMLELLPEAAVGHVGVERDARTHLPSEYYCKLPHPAGDYLFFVADPMLATGGSACHVVTALKERGAVDIALVCLIAAPEGIRRVHGVHPDVRIHVAAVDERLDANAYIVPGLGDAGDRLFGTSH